MSTVLTNAALLELLSYSPLSGVFHWKKKRRGVRVDLPLGTDNGFGYLRITVLGRSYYAHRLAWFYCHAKWPAYQIDHINGNRGDNRLANLRDIPEILNAQNKTRPHKDSKSQSLGVSWHAKSGKWQAHICVFKQRRYLGLFDDAKEAHTAFLIEKEKIQYE